MKFSSNFLSSLSIYSRMDLNSNQKIAINNFSNPMLIVAGAGTGKTSTIVAKILRAIETGFAEPSQILATTFTNKAAAELRDRIEAKLGPAAHQMTIGTFHSISLDMLQKYNNETGNKEVISVLDYDDQLQVVKRVITKLGIKDKTPISILEMIQRYKEEDKCLFNYCAEVVNHYQEELYKDHMMDFTDLLLNFVKLLEDDKPVRERYQKQMKLICIDEYQDINNLQHRWVQLFLDGTNHLCCVGDPDQAIYAFRGANASHILNFDKAFPNAQIVKLECNYRSTPSILQAANNLIAQNKKRIPKNLYTSNPELPNSIVLWKAREASSEAIGIANGIIEIKETDSTASIGILVRNRFQVAAIEEALIRRKVTYKVSGAVQFMDRAEVKDMLSYFKFFYNLNDSIAFRRLAQSPKRGVGPALIDKILDKSRESKVNILEGIRIVANESTKLTEAKLANFIEFLDQSISVTNNQPLHYSANHIYTASCYIDAISDERKENVRQWIKSLQSFSSLNDYMQSILLQKDQSEDRVDVQLMTIHAAKGLEFDYTFLPGWEWGILPSFFAKSDLEREEERRLAYVAVTRARKRVTISHNAMKQVRESMTHSEPSPFLAELGSKLRYSSIPSLSLLPIGSDVAHPRFGLGVVEQSTEEFARVKFLDCSRLVESRILRRL